MRNHPVHRFFGWPAAALLLLAANAQACPCAMARVYAELAPVEAAANADADCCAAKAAAEAETTISECCTLGARCCCGHPEAAAFEAALPKSPNEILAPSAQTQLPAFLPAALAANAARLAPMPAQQRAPAPRTQSLFVLHAVFLC